METVPFSVRNCTYGCQVYITKQQYSSDLLLLKIKRNCIVDKCSQYVLLTNHSHYVCPCICSVMPNGNKDKNTTVRFSVRNCTYGFQMYYKCITKHQYSSDLWPLKIRRNCIVDKSLAVRFIVYL